MHKKSSFKKLSLGIAIASLLSACQSTGFPPAESFTLSQKSPDFALERELQLIEAQGGNTYEGRQSLAGQYLIARQAQRDRNWQIAASGWSDILEASGETLRKEETLEAEILNRASLTALGAGNYNLAISKARTVLEEKGQDQLTAFDQLILASFAAKREHYDLAKTVFNDIDHPAFKQLVVPLMLAQIEEQPEDLIQKGMADGYAQIAQLFQDEARVDSGLLFARLATYMDPDLHGVSILLGDILSRGGNYREAYDLYLEEPEDSPYFMQSRISALTMLYNTGEEQLAIDGLQDMTWQVEDPATVWATLANVYKKEQRHKDAVHAYTKFITSQEPEADQTRFAYFLRGASYERMGKWKRAEDDLLKALHHFPDNPDILNYLGYSWVDRNEKVDEGEALIRKALKLRPEDGHITDSLGWALYRRGEYKEAVEVLERAVALLPYDSVINDHLGDAYWKVGRRTEARFQWQRALDYQESAAEGIDPDIVERKIEDGLTPEIKAMKAAALK